MDPLQSRILSALVPLGLALAFASPLSAVPLTLQDGGAVLEVDPESREGLGPWSVDGIAHLRQQGFWVRAGADASESSLADLDFNGATPSDADMDGDDESLVASWSDPSGRFDVSLEVVLSGLLGSPSLGSESDILLEVSVENTSGGALDVTLFQYTDVDLFGSFVDDDATFGSSLLITDSSGLGRYESSFDAAPDAVEASLFDALLMSLEDGSATALSGALAASGDVTTAVAYATTLGAGESLGFEQLQSLRVDPVSAPEPAVLPLLALAALPLAAARRR